MKSAALLYRLLGDEARLRLLRVLAKERLNVTELTGVLGLAQSGVSRHLGLLKDAGLVVEERDGGFSYYRLAAGLREGSLAGVLQQQFEESAADGAAYTLRQFLLIFARLRLGNLSHSARSSPVSHRFRPHPCFMCTATNRHWQKCKGTTARARALQLFLPQ